jgi:hypothetical protein
VARAPHLQVARPNEEAHLGRGVLLDVAEDLLDRAGDDAPVFHAPAAPGPDLQVRQREALHGVRLARSCLAVRENGRVVAGEGRVHDASRRRLVHKRLRGVLVVNVVEGEGVRVRHGAADAGRVLPALQVGGRGLRER